MVSSENIETNSRVVGEKDDLNVPEEPETEAAEDSEVYTGAESNKRLSSGLESASDISEDELKDDEASLSSEGEEEKRRSCDKKEEEVIELDTDSNDSVPFLPPPVSAIIKPKEDKKQMASVESGKSEPKHLEVDSKNESKVTDKDSEGNKSVDSNDGNSSTPRDGLRFLTGMETRVKDKCKVPQVAGKTGFVLSTGCTNDQVEVMLKDKG